MIVKEYGKQIPGQMSFSDMSEPAEKDGEKTKIAAMPRALRANG